LWGGIVETKEARSKEESTKVTYWRSGAYQFSILYKGIVTEINRDDIGYHEMDKLDGAIHAAIGCKQNPNRECKEKRKGKTL